MLVGDPHNLNIKLTLNGQVMQVCFILFLLLLLLSLCAGSQCWWFDSAQNSNTSKFIFNVPKVVSYISNVVTLQPGDLIFTGTPPGIGAARKPPVFLKNGDTCVLEIEKLGTLTNTVEYPADI